MVDAADNQLCVGKQVHQPDAGAIHRRAFNGPGTVSTFHFPWVRLDGIIQREAVAFGALLRHGRAYGHMMPPRGSGAAKACEQRTVDAVVIDKQYVH